MLYGLTGSHGAGDPSETLTPLVAWGAGIRSARYIETSSSAGRHSPQGTVQSAGEVVQWQSIGLITLCCGSNLAPVICRLLSYCVLRPTQPPTLCGMAVE